MNAGSRFVTAPLVGGDGSGTWPYRISEAAFGLQRSMMRDMLALTTTPGIISFAGGLPAPELFPTDEYQACVDHVLTQEGRRALQYSPPCQELKEAIAQHMAGRGVNASPGEVFITTGAQQALYILSRLLIDPASPVILEEIVYTGIPQALRLLRPQTRTVPTDLETGMDIEAVEAQLAREPRARALFVLPDFHNPLGVSLSSAKRPQLVSLSRRYGVPIIEDDPYGSLRFTAPLTPPLKAWDEDGGVIYVGSFSKILAPALRLGWVVAPPFILQRLTVLKETVDLETSALTQRAVAEFCRRGYLERHLARLRTTYHRRLEAMLAALARELPPETHWSAPEGGMFLWVVLPKGMDTMSLLPQALAQQVAFIPGTAFAVQGGGANALRLNFSNASPETIAEGMERLGRVIQEAIP